METPFAKASPWRSLVIYGSAWLTACSLWVGFTRRRSLRIFFCILATNAFFLALLGIAQRGLHADKIFWFWEPPAAYFVSSFIYKNHAGAYFDLLFSLCLGLAATYHERSRRRLDKSSPSGLFAFFGITRALIVIFSYSRAATILLLVFLGFTLVAFLGRKYFISSTQPVGNAGVAALLCGFCLACPLCRGLYFLPTGEAINRMDQLVRSYEAASPSTRHLATLATMETYFTLRQPTAGGQAASAMHFQSISATIRRSTSRELSIITGNMRTTTMRNCNGGTPGWLAPFLYSSAELVMCRRAHAAPFRSNLLACQCTAVSSPSFIAWVISTSSTRPFSSLGAPSGRQLCAGWN